MCFGPELLAGLVLSGAGTLYNNRQQQKNANRMQAARDNAFNLEMQRQDEYQGETADIFDKAAKRYEGANQAQQENQAVANRERNVGDLIKDENDRYALPTSGSAPKVVRSEGARRMADAAAEAKGQAKRQAKLAGFGDVLFGNRLASAGTSNRLGTLSNFAGRSAQLMPYEQRSAANNARKAPGMFGDLLKLAGTGVSLYGMGGGSFGDLFSAPADKVTNFTAYSP